MLLENRWEVSGMNLKDFDIKFCMSNKCPYLVEGHCNFRNFLFKKDCYLVDD